MTAEWTSALSEGWTAPGGTSRRMVSPSSPPKASAEGCRHSFPPSGPTDCDWTQNGIQQWSSRAASAAEGGGGGGIVNSEHWTPLKLTHPCLKQWSLCTHPSLWQCLVLSEDLTPLQQAERGPAWLGRRKHALHLDG